MSSAESVFAAPPASFHFCRVTRQENRFLEERIVRSEEIHRLAAENQGLFAGGFANVPKMERKLETLARCESAQRWIVVVSSKLRLLETEERLREHDDLSVEGSRRSSSFRADYLRFTTLEALPRNAPKGLDGVILYDPQCTVHRARRFERYDGSNHDRPQILADFLAKRSEFGMSPLLCLLTLKPPVSCNTTEIGAAYMLDGWIFADPHSLSFVDDGRGNSREGWSQ